MSKAIEIVVNEKTLKCSFGLGFLGECLENLDLSVVQIGEKLDKNPFKWIPVLMYESIKYNKDVEFTIDDLIEWLDNEEGKATMNSFLLAFIDSLRKDVPKQESTVKKRKPQQKK
jgi:hypothetical protein